MAGRRCQPGGYAIHVHVTNTSNLPVEALETEYPLIVEEYGLVEGSGGAGKHRGGLGIARQIRALDGHTVFTCRSDGQQFAADGVLGGQSGGKSRLYLNYGQSGQLELPSKVSGMMLSTSDSVRIETSGAGGYGPPRERSKDDVLRDLADGVIGEQDARIAYGLSS